MLKSMLAAVVAATAFLGMEVGAQAEDIFESPLGISHVGNDAEVTLLNAGGKNNFVQGIKNALGGEVSVPYVKEGTQCRVGAGSLVYRHSSGAKPGTLRVRLAMPAQKDGDCPFGTIFEMQISEFNEGAKAYFQQVHSTR